LTQVYIELTGWVPRLEGAPQSIISLRERILSGIAGLFVGDFASVLGPGGLGYRGVVGNLAGQVAALEVLKIIGITVGIFSPFVLLPGLLAGFFWATKGLEDRIKAKAIERVDPGLRNLPEKVWSALEGEAKKLLDDIKEEVTKEVSAAIEAEEQNIREIMELNKRSQAEKTRSLTVLDGVNRKIITQRQALKETMVQAEQTA
jgi:hypothetical protein